MKATTRTSTVTAALIAGVLLPTYATDASAQSSLSSRVAVLVSNDFGPEPPDGPSAIRLAGETANSAESIFLSETFAFGSEGDLSLSGTASAATSYQRLRAAVTGDVSGSFYNSEFDPRFFDQETGEVQEEFGKPDYFAVDAESQFTETLQYGGTATNYNSRYFLNLSGTVSGEGAFVFVEVDHATSGQGFRFFSRETGDFNIPIVTEAFVGSANQQFSVRLLTSFQVQTDDGGGGSFAGAAEFGSTLEFLGVEVREEESGRLLSASEITSDSGTVYAVVPEPATALLVLAGLPLLRRRETRG